MNSVLQIRETIRSGKRTVEQCITDAFNTAVESQARLRAFCYLPAMTPVNLAGPIAPLAGVAVAVKDIIDTADMPTEFNSPAYKGRRPERDAWVVARLRAAGASIIGKTVTTEFAWRRTGPTMNPWNAEHTPGGSSSGSAAAVGAGVIPLALGTQTQGSVIRPAAYCGAVGFKATYGAIARTGVLQLAGSLDHLGMFTRSVADAAHVFNVLRGADDADPHDAYVCPSVRMSRGRRIGVLSKQVGGAIDPAQQAALDSLAARLSLDGAQIVEVRLADELFNAADHALTLMAVESAIVHGDLVDRAPDLVSPEMQALVATGRKIPAQEYAKAKELQTSMAHRFQTWLKQTESLDALLVAPASGEAPRGLEHTGDASFCAAWTFLGMPAVTVPVSFGPAGLPLGAQLVGAAHEDEGLLALAGWAERRTGWSEAVRLRSDAVTG